MNDALPTIAATGADTASVTLNKAANNLFMDFPSRCHACAALPKYVPFCDRACTFARL